MSEKRWINFLIDLGCIVCLNEQGVKSPPDIHHVHKNNRRIDDMHTIPLCFIHHRSGINNKNAVSRHPFKRAFEKRYGTEIDLLKQVQDLFVG